MADIELLNRFAEIVGQSSNEIISNYAVWYFAAGISYTIAGSFLMFLAFKWKASKEWLFPFPQVLRGAMFAVGLLMVVANVPDIVAPEGIATHKLIKDIRGR